MDETPISIQPKNFSNKYCIYHYYFPKMGGCYRGQPPICYLKWRIIMIEITETTPIWTFKKQLENQVGKISKR